MALSMNRLTAIWTIFVRCSAAPHEKGVRIEFVKKSLNFTGEDSPMANLMLSVTGVFAEFEWDLIKLRQRKGIVLARKRGAYRG